MLFLKYRNYLKYKNYRKHKDCLKNVLAAFGVILWVGTLSPEIFVKPGAGCILDENGQELSAEDAEAFMEAYFYADKGETGDGKVKIKYKSALLEWLEK